MVSKTDHYSVLGLPSGKEGRHLTKDEIRKAYKLQALKLHPDKRRNDPSAVSEFQKLKSSYECLVNSFLCSSGSTIPPMRQTKMQSHMRQTKMQSRFCRKMEEEMARFRYARRRNYRAKKTDEFQSRSNKSDDNCRCNSEAPEAKKTKRHCDLEEREKRSASVMKAALKREEERLSKFFQDEIAKARAMRQNKSD